MAKYFAELDNQSIVKRVIVADSIEWCVDNLGGNWVETFLDTPGKTYAGPGHKHSLIKDDFVEPRPFPSWNLDENDDWQPPVKKPEGKLFWDEIKKDWIKIK